MNDVADHRQSLRSILWVLEAGNDGRTPCQAAAGAPEGTGAVARVGGSDLMSRQSSMQPSQDGHPPQGALSRSREDANLRRLQERVLIRDRGWGVALFHVLSRLPDTLRVTGASQRVSRPSWDKAMLRPLCPGSCQKTSRQKHLVKNMP